MDARVGGAVSNDDGAVELYPDSDSISEDSEPQDSAYASAGIISLDVSGNIWRQDDDLNSDDPRGFWAPVRDPILSLPSILRCLEPS